MGTDGTGQPAAYVNRGDLRDGRQQVSMEVWQTFQTAWHHITKPVFVTLRIAFVECIMPNQKALLA